MNIYRATAISVTFHSFILMGGIVHSAFKVDNSLLIGSVERKRGSAVEFTVTMPHGDSSDFSTRKKKSKDERNTPGAHNSLQGVISTQASFYARNNGPVYPYYSIMNREEGSVYLAITISSQGHVTAVKVLSSSGHEDLDNAAITSVKGWTFTLPESITIEEITISQRIHFRLKD